MQGTISITHIAISGSRIQQCAIPSAQSSHVPSTPSVAPCDADPAAARVPRWVDLVEHLGLVGIVSGARGGDVRRLDAPDLMAGCMTHAPSGRRS